jgi:cell division septation protein DedD
MDACGLQESQAATSQAPCVLSTTLAELRGRIDEERMEALIAIQAAAAMDAGRVSPAHLVIDPFPVEPGSQRVTDATTRSKAQKKPSSASRTSHSKATAEPQRSRVKPRAANRTCKRGCGALAARVEGTALCS